ncbi:MAG: 50S ribosomal protein L6 [Conexivisphaerales archaeon]
MATSTKSKEGIELEIAPPEGVRVSMNGSILVVNGPKGKVERDFSKIPIRVAVENGKVKLYTLSSKKFDRSVLNTCRSHVENMYRGVTKGFSYRLKVVFAHFPITVKVQGNEVLLENFYGERAPRRARIVGDQTKVTVEGDDIVVSGPSLEGVAQTAANIEQATKVREKDQRVFLDGVYIYQRKVSE